MQACSLPPDWAICDMFFDLHCGLRPPEAIPPGGKVSVQCLIEYWDAKQSAPFEAHARHLPITGDDYRHWYAPRIELGRIETPVLTVPPGDVDYFVWIDVVLDGAGVAWLTDMDVELQDVDEPLPPIPIEPPTRSPEPALH